MSRENTGRLGRPLRSRGALLLLCLAACAVSAPVCIAQEQVPNLTLTPDPSLPGGTASAIYGSADQDGLRAGLPGLSIVQPVALTLIARDAARPLALELFKFASDGAVKHVVTGADGIVTIKFRSEGGVILRIAAERENAEFAFLAWVGDEVKDVGGRLVVPPRGKDSQGAVASAAGSPPGGQPGGEGGGILARALRWAALAVGLAAVGLFLVVRKKRSAAARALAVALAIAVCSSLVSAQAGTAIKTFDELKSFNKLLDAWGKGEKGAGDFGITIVQDLHDLLGGYPPLTPEDKSYDPSYPPPGAPQLESQCAESIECKECFQPAYDNLGALLFRFEKLRRVYTSGKTTARRGMAFGDNAASIHGIAGLAWQSEKIKVEQSVKVLEQAYDAKYAELMAELDKVLKQLTACEAQVYGEKDWYNRFGFMYYQFMRSAYARRD